MKKSMRDDMTAEEKADLDAMFEEIYAEALKDGADPQNIEEFKEFREHVESLPLIDVGPASQDAGAEQYMIVNEDSLHDEDGPHEIDPAIVPEYAKVDKQNVLHLEILANELTRNFDGRYVVISNTRYWELKNT